MTTASQIIIPLARLDLVDTLLAILTGTGVTASIMLSSSVGGPQSIALSVNAEDITNWRDRLTPLRASLITQLATLGVTLT